MPFGIVTAIWWHFLSLLVTLASSLYSRSIGTVAFECTAGSVDASRTDTLSAAQGVGDSPSSSQPLDGATAAPVSGPAIVCYAVFLIYSVELCVLRATQRGPGGASNKHARVSAAATAAAWPAAADGRASNGQVQLPAVR